MARPLEKPAKRVLFALLCAGFLLLVPSAAFAEITEDDIGCRGSADIRDKDGETTRVDAEDAEATIPREGTVRWRGATDDAVHNHEGEIGIDLGLGTVPVESWGGANGKDETEKRGRKQLPEVLKYLPPGTYVVSGGHDGDEGSCDGEIEITLEGGPATAWKAGGIALTVLTAVGLVAAGRPRG